MCHFVLDKLLKKTFKRVMSDNPSHLKTICKKTTEFLLNRLRTCDNIKHVQFDCNARTKEILRFFFNFKRYDCDFEKSLSTRPALVITQRGAVLMLKCLHECLLFKDRSPRGALGINLARLQVDLRLCHGNAA